MQYLTRRWNAMPAEERFWSQTRFALFSVYVVSYVAFFVIKGIIIDRISVTISVLLLMICATIGRPWRRWVRLLGDIVLYAIMWVIYEETRSWGQRAGMPLQVTMPINIDRALFFGEDPNVWMQRKLYRPAVRWYDIYASLLYFTHFCVPPIVIATLWARGRQHWIRFMRRFATLLFVACAGFVLLPTAPPWAAAGGKVRFREQTLQLDELEPLARHTSRGWSHLGLGYLADSWKVATKAQWSNPVAAMPSLHAGFAFLIAVYFWKAIPWLWARVALVVIYPVGMVAALVYFGEHYVADALASWLIIGAAFWFWGWWERAHPIATEHDHRRLWFEGPAPLAMTVPAEPTVPSPAPAPAPAPAAGDSGAAGLMPAPTPPRATDVSDLLPPSE